MQNKKPKILFTFVEAGLGHIIPMTGMSQAFTRKYGDKCEIINSYVFRPDETDDQNVVKMGKVLYDCTKLSGTNIFFNKLEGFAYNFTTKFTHWFLDIYLKKGEEGFIKKLQEINPDLVVGSYYLPTHLTAKANKRGLTNAFTVTYTPDPYVYPAWDRNCDLFLVNNQVAYDIALNKGFDKDKVKQIPVIYRDQVINLDKTKEQLREELNLKQDKLQVLYSCGAYGTKKSALLIKEILQDNDKVELTAICGINEELEKELNNLKESLEDKDFNVLGYSDKVPEYMKAADVVIGKSGSNTVMEAAYIGTPMIISDTVSRLEEITAEWAVEQGIAVLCREVKKIVEIIKNYTLDRSYFDDMKKNFEKFKKSDGAEQAADLIYQLLLTKFDLE